MNTAPPFIAILLKPHTALRRLAVQPRTVFGGAPCMRLYEYRYTYSTSAQAYVKRLGTGCALAHRFGMTKAATNPSAPADFPPPPVGEDRGGVRPHTADAAKTTKTAPSLTYTTSAQMYIKHLGIGCALAHRFRMTKTATNPSVAADFPPPPVGEGRGGVCPHTADAIKETDRSLTYTLSAQVYVKHMGTGCALAHRHLPNYPTIARSPTALLPLPVGLKQLARSERKGWGEGNKKSSVASTIDLYRDHFTCPNTTEHTARNPTPALPHRGRESFRYSSTFRALNNHSARASAHRLCPEKRSRAAFLLPPPQPSPTGEGSLSAVPPPFAR